MNPPASCPSSFSWPITQQLAAWKVPTSRFREARTRSGGLSRREAEPIPGSLEISPYVILLVLRLVQASLYSSLGECVHTHTHMRTRTLCRINNYPVREGASREIFVLIRVGSRPGGPVRRAVTVVSRIRNRMTHRQRPCSKSTCAKLEKLVESFGQVKPALHIPSRPDAPRSSKPLVAICNFVRAC